MSDPSTEYLKYMDDSKSVHESKKLKERAGTVHDTPGPLGTHTRSKSWKGKKKKIRSGSIRSGIDPKTGKPTKRVLGGFATRPKKDTEESEY